MTKHTHDNVTRDRIDSWTRIVNADSVDTVDTTADGDKTDARRSAKLAIVILAIAAVVVSLAWNSAQTLALQTAAEGHGITAQLAGLVSGTSDEAIAAVDLAHHHVNDSVWGTVGSKARAEACDALATAGKHAAGLGYSAVELKNIAAVQARCEDDSVGGYDLHESVVGLEHYMRTGQGR